MELFNKNKLWFFKLSTGGVFINKILENKYKNYKLSLIPSALGLVVKTFFLKNGLLSA